MHLATLANAHTTSQERSSERIPYKMTSQRCTFAANALNLLPAPVSTESSRLGRQVLDQMLQSKLLFNNKLFRSID